MVILRILQAIFVSIDYPIALSILAFTFTDKGQVEVFESASDKKFLRTNLSDGIKEGLKLNKTNATLLGMSDIKIFEVGTVWCPNEEIRIAYNEKEKIIEMKLNEFCKASTEFNSESTNIFLVENFSARASRPAQGFHNQTPASPTGSAALFKMWSLFPFIARDIAVWVPEEVTSEEVQKVIKDNAGELAIMGPELFDEFKKDGKISYAFRTVFQSFERTLTDAEINEIMTNITNKIKDKNGWQVR